LGRWALAGGGSIDDVQRMIRQQALPAATEPHETRANSVLRPIVFGANDGLVSNLALVMGVAAARPETSVIVLAGIAGLIAGAFSMAVGEYISVQSQRELLDFQRAFQLKQLRDAPHQERTILAQSFTDRGFEQSEAERIADVILEDHDRATSLLLYLEVGLDDRSIGSPIQAAIGSFVAFTAGAFIPLLPFLVANEQVALSASLAASLGALALLGIAIARLTRRSAWYCAVRQVLLGGAAAAVTYVVGTALGVSAG
jgi:vacuolar iron transporter family protein